MFFPLWRAPVFGIKAYKVDAIGQGGVVLKQPSQLQHHGNSTGTIVGSHHRFAPIGAVRVVVGPRTTVPVGTEQDAFGGLWFVFGHDVGGMQHGAVIAFHIRFLCGHIASKLLEFTDNPIGTLLVRLAIHGTRAKVALCLDESVSRVGVECWSHRLLCQGCFILVARFCRGSFRGLPAQSHGCGQNDTHYCHHDYLFFLHWFVCLSIRM